MATPVKMTSLERFKKNLEHIIRASFACIWIRTQEEERTIKVVNQVIKKLEGKDAMLYIWDVGGDIVQYVEDEEKTSATKRKIDNPSLVFPTFASSAYKDKSALVVLDFNYYVGDNPEIIRSIKNSIGLLKRDGKIVIIVGPRLPLPEEIEKEISLINFPLPERDDLRKYLDFVIDSARKEAKTAPISEDVKEKIVDAALGLTSQEAEDAFSLAVVKNIQLNGDSIKTVLDQKCQILRKEGTLEYINPEEKMDDIGGLDVLKDWLIKRKTAFNKAAVDFIGSSPKGILIVGISGCGKSLTAKACASNWEIGIYRLDVGKIFTKLLGESESNARRVIEVVDAVAPAILWIDEIEKGMAGARSSGELDSGVTARVIGTLLTWMQEKKSPVFVVATANDVTKLPPELLRKGRFDEIFFVDLPNDEERLEIVKIQLRKRNRELSETEMRRIVQGSAGYTGAEIEQAVIAGLYICLDDGKRNIKADDIIVSLKASPPLAATMEEEVTFLRDWGNTRARNASGKLVPTFAKVGRADAPFATGRKLNVDMVSKKEEEAPAGVTIPPKK